MERVRRDYQARLDAHAARLARLTQTVERTGWARNAMVVAGVAMLCLVAEKGLFAEGWLAIPVGLALASHVAGELLRARVAPATRAVAWYRRGIARLDGSWIGLGPTGTTYADEDHTYGADLDVFGRGSLFDFLCTTSTDVGEKMLARWLLAPAPIEVIRARQRAIAELAERARLREEIAALGEQVVASDPEALVRWGEGPATLPGRWLAWVVNVLACAILLSVIAWAGLGWGPWPSVAGVSVAAGCAWFLRGRITIVLADVVDASSQLALVARVSSRLAREPFQSPLLLDLRDRLLTPPAARALSHLGRLARRTQMLRNELVAPMAYALGAPLQMAAAMEAWRARHGDHLRGWLEAVGQLEALLALSAHAHEFRDHVYPEVVDGPPVFDAEALGHPLLPAAACVRNDVIVGDGAAPLLLLSGSNMSGKSTLLRAVGLATVLAAAGAPVRARRLRVTRMSLGVSIRVRDSVLEGVSRFYSEITRLRAIVDLAERCPPVLFLLDEILSGTNSDDRRQGAEGLLRGLLGRNAIGICTTHDLALTEMSKTLDGRAANAHFSDQLLEGKLVFDYRLRPGVVRQSNALELMRAIGLKV